MKTNRVFPIILTVLFLGSFVIYLATLPDFARGLAQKKDEPATTEAWGEGGTKITTRTKNEHGTEVEVRYIDSKNNPRAKERTTTSSRDGSSFYEHEIYGCDGKPSSYASYSFDSSGDKTTSTTEQYEGSTKVSGDVLEYEYEPGESKYEPGYRRVKSHKKFNPKTQAYEEKELTYPEKKWLPRPLKPEKTASLTPDPSPCRVESIGPSALPGYKIDNQTNSGLYTVTFTTPQGKLKVNLTDDLAAGDTISGTVEEEPTGGNENERAQSQSDLNGYVVEMEQQQTRVTEKSITRHIPETLTVADRRIRLLRDGREVARTEVPISSEPKPTPTVFILPTGGQQGKAIEIKGPCNGVFANTDYVKIGGTIVPTLAESPRKKVVRDTGEVIGPTKIECRENDKVTECPFRNLGINLSADKLSLLKGETTKLHLVVLGLAGLDQEVPLDLVNNSPGIIAMSGGNEQHMTIRAGDGQGDGTYQMDRTLTGIMKGAFGITATVRWENLCSDGQPVNSDSAEEIARGSSYAKDVEGPPGKGGKPIPYRTCGGACKSPVTDPSGTFCSQERSCTENVGCACHMYDSKGKDDVSKWEHVWKPGDSKKVEDPNFRCLCVKRK